jgi:hypothetical protein
MNKRLRNNERYSLRKSSQAMLSAYLQSGFDPIVLLEKKREGAKLVE